MIAKYMKTEACLPNSLFSFFPSAENIEQLLKMPEERLPTYIGRESSSSSSSFSVFMLK